MKRRDVLKSAAAAAAGLAFPGVLNAALTESPYLNRIGLQLWTVRNQLAADPDGTIRAIAAAGYRQVELMDVMMSDDILTLAGDNGLKVTSSFFDWNVIGNPAADGVRPVEQIVEKAQAAGLKHLVFGYLGKGHRETADQFKAHAERANAAGEVCRKAGIQLNYHNHSFEFAELPGGHTGYDVFIREFDPQLTKFELDVFWAQIGGRPPLPLIEELNTRIAQLHLKDLKAATPVIHDESRVPADAFQELGDGVIDLAAIVKAAATAGVDQCHVEQDQSDDPLQSIVQSLRHLKSA